MEKNKIYLGDANEFLEKIPDGTVDLLVTDPPYIKDQWEQAYSILARHTPRILKPSGWLITYSGHYNLNRVMRMLDDSGLMYYWTYCQLNQGPTAVVFARNVSCGWKPILIYQKPPLKRLKSGFHDVIKSEVQKADHPWQQSLDDVLTILRRFSQPGQYLVEPFCGSGTTISGAKQCGLEWNAFEIDPEAYKVALARQVRESLFDGF